MRDHYLNLIIDHVRFQFYHTTSRKQNNTKREHENKSNFYQPKAKKYNKTRIYKAQVTINDTITNTIRGGQQFRKNK